SLGWWKRRVETSGSNTWSANRSEQLRPRIFVGCGGWDRRTDLCLERRRRRRFGRKTWGTLLRVALPTETRRTPKHGLVRPRPRLQSLLPRLQTRWAAR